MLTTAPPHAARNVSIAAAFVILALLSFTSTTFAARHQSRCPSHCRAGGWGPGGGLLRLPECAQCSPPPPDRAIAGSLPAVTRASASPSSPSSSSSSAAVLLLDDVDRAAEPNDISVDVADEVPRYGKKKSCAKWCHYIPAIKWIPECKDCDTDMMSGPVNDAAAASKKRTKNCQKKEKNPLSPTKKIRVQRDREKKRDASSNWLIDVMLRPFRRSRHHEDRSLRAAPNPAPGCAAWCEMVPGKKAKQWIPGCLGCEGDSEEEEGESIGTSHLSRSSHHVRGASKAETEEMPCMKWCDFVPPATMKLVPPCMGCDVPKPTGECPSFCTYLPVREAASVPACSSCYE